MQKFVIFPSETYQDQENAKDTQKNIVTRTRYVIARIDRMPLIELFPGFSFVDISNIFSKLTCFFMVICMQALKKYGKNGT